MEDKAMIFKKKLAKTYKSKKDLAKLIIACRISRLFKEPINYSKKTA
jgi:hypothetical protein